MRLPMAVFRTLLRFELTSYCQSGATFIRAGHIGRYTRVVASVGFFQHVHSEGTSVVCQCGLVFPATADLIPIVEPQDGDWG